MDRSHRSGVAVEFQSDEQLRDAESVARVKARRCHALGPGFGFERGRFALHGDATALDQHVEPMAGGNAVIFKTGKIREQIPVAFAVCVRTGVRS